MTALEHTLHVFQISKPAYIAILGAGGIGKTSLALSILHHPLIIQRFKDMRWFIPCEGIVDAEGLKSAMAATFEVDERRLIPALKRMAITIQNEMMLTLDNLETPWEPM